MPFEKHFPNFLSRFSLYSHWIHVNLSRIDENFAMQRAHRPAQHPLAHHSDPFVPAVAAALFLISSLSAVSSRDFPICKSKIRCMWPKSTSHTQVACIANYQVWCLFHVWSMYLKLNDFEEKKARFRFSVLFQTFVLFLIRFDKTAKTKQTATNQWNIFCHISPIHFRLPSAPILSFCMTGIAQKRASFGEVDVEACLPRTQAISSRNGFA